MREIDALRTAIESTAGTRVTLHLTRAKQILAALEAAREDAWQPIETAPKDGTTVIGFWCGSRGTIGIVNGTNYGITAFNPDSGEWYDASEADNEDDELARPDFWRSLPAPPAIDQARGKGKP